jgi:hypothetical protein
MEPLIIGLPVSNTVTTQRGYGPSPKWQPGWILYYKIGIKSRYWELLFLLAHRSRVCLLCSSRFTQAIPDPHVFKGVQVQAVPRLFNENDVRPVRKMANLQMGTIYQTGSRDKFLFLSRKVKFQSFRLHTHRSYFNNQSIVGQTTRYRVIQV